MANRYDNTEVDRIADREPGPIGPQMSVLDFASAALATWRGSDERTDQTVTRMGEIVVRFERRLNATGIDTADEIDTPACIGFIDAPSRTGDAPAEATRHFRRVTLRALFRTGRQLGVLSDDPTVDIELPPRTSLRARPLTSEELVLCRTAVFIPGAHDLRRPAAWALAEATATTSEIPELRRGDLLPNGDIPEAVVLPGTRRTHRARSS